MFSQDVKERIEGVLVEGQLPCAGAFKVAAELRYNPLLIGQAADEMQVQLSRCQLGLFGYGPKEEGKHRIVEPMGDIPAGLEEAIREAWTGKGITCLQAWNIADRLGFSKREVADACEGLGVKITVCQLGSFPRPKMWEGIREQE